jgi:hypothetical protein
MSCTFTWQSAGLNQARFRAYSSLLLLKTGIQVSHRLDPEDNFSDCDEYDLSDDADSISPQTLSSFDEVKLKEAFQDRVAELVSNLKGGEYVAATLLIEHVDCFEVVVARNEGLNQADRKFLRKMQSLLRGIAKGSGESYHALL